MTYLREEIARAICFRRPVPCDCRSGKCEAPIDSLFSPHGSTVKMTDAILAILDRYERPRCDRAAIVRECADAIAAMPRPPDARGDNYATGLALAEARVRRIQTGATWVEIVGSEGEGND